MRALKFIDMFCGMGTIRMGFEQAGHTCVYSIEWDKHKRKIYEVIFGNEPEASDIRAIRGADLPISDCWCFGAPCQDFSIAGQRSGMEGDRSSLVREVFRLVREIEEKHRPEWLLYENVKGMLSSNKGLDYLEILFEMASLGYDIEFQLLNSKNFGVPQNRERVFTLGHSRRYGERKIFPIGEISTKFNVPYEQIDNPSLDKNGCVTAIDASYYKGYGVRSNKCRAVVMSKDSQSAAISIDLKSEKSSTRRGMDKNGYTGALDTQCNVGVLFTQKEITKEVDISNTLTARNPSTSRGNYTPITGIVNGSRIRRLTPRECMRLQGVPDYITDKLIAAGISGTQLYRAAGDACTVNVIYEIAKRL